VQDGLRRCSPEVTDERWPPTTLTLIPTHHLPCCRSPVPVRRTSSTCPMPMTPAPGPPFPHPRIRAFLLPRAPGCPHLRLRRAPPQLGRSVPPRVTRVWARRWKPGSTPPSTPSPAPGRSHPSAPTWHRHHRHHRHHLPHHHRRYRPHQVSPIPLMNCRRYGPPGPSFPRTSRPRRLGRLRRPRFHPPRFLRP